MTATPVTSATLRADLERAFKSKHITVDPAGAADLALQVVLPVLQRMAGEIKRRDAEIDRLRKLVAEYVVTGKSSSEGEERRA